jgi:hypothetical protein
VALVVQAAAEMVQRQATLMVVLQRQILAEVAVEHHNLAPL